MASVEMIEDHFDGWPLPRWTHWLQGNGRIEPRDSTARLVTQDARRARYSDAQLDDYHADSSGRRRRWQWRPPLRLSVRARASHTNLTGTAGFGFWNDPFELSGAVTALPQSIWFFYASSHSNMALAPGVPGCGWKAALVNTTRANAWRAGVPTAFAVLWARLTGRTHRAERWVQRISGAQEVRLDLDWTQWHTYELDWLRETAIFRVDGGEVLHAFNPPPGPLGFVTWVDTQFAVATPRGEFRFGTLDAPGEQWLELDWIRIE
jgi:hypothetical protein